MAFLEQDHTTGTGDILHIQNDGSGRSIYVEGGGIVEEGGVLKSNLLTNSGFGVWSNSTLEDVGSDLAVNGDFSSATGWTAQTGWAIDTSAGNAVATGAADGQQLFRTFSSFVVGKLYKMSITCTAFTGGTAQLYSSLPAVNSSEVITGASQTITQVFEATATSGTISIQITTAGSGLTVDNFTLYEVTPACVDGTNKAFDGWTKRDNVSHKIYRQHSDGGTLTQDGSFYSCKVVTTTETASQVLTFPGAYGSNAEWYERFAGRTVTLGCWVKAGVASSAKLVISDGVTTYSASDWYDTGGADWQWLEVTKSDTSASPTKFTVGLATVKADTTYFSQPMVCLGSAIGSGNYSAPSGEIVWLELMKSSDNYDDFDGISSSTAINTEADTGGKIPKGAKAVYVTMAGSCASTEKYLALANEAGKNRGIWAYSQVANGRVANSGWVPCDGNGDILWERNDTFNEVYLWYSGVQL